MKPFAHCLIYPAIFLGLVFSAHAQEQEPLLELPGTVSSQDSPSGKLELLSPAEISDLYSTPATSSVAPAEEPTLTPEIIPPSPVAPPVAAAPPPPALPDVTEEVDSYTSLLEDLDSDNVDPQDESVDINAVWSHQSIMLLPQEVKIFNAALTRYLKSLAEPVVEIIDEVLEEEGPPPVYYPFITLDSLMYVGPDNWAAWINGKRFAPRKLEELPGLSVEKVAKNAITIRWKEPPVEKVELQQDVNLNNPFVMVPEQVRQQLTAQQEGKELSRNKPSTLPTQVEEKEDGYYLITLSPNQAFITDDFSILEGRAATKRVAEIYDYQQYKKRQAVLAAQKQSDLPPEVTKKEKQEQEELEKLLQLYENSGIVEPKPPM